MPAKRTDTTFSLDTASRARLTRLEKSYGGKSAAIREALLRLEVSESYARDLARDAVLAAAAAVRPDGQYDPADDPRPETAALQLCAVFGSMPLAEGILAALRELSMDY